MTYRTCKVLLFLPGNAVIVWFFKIFWLIIVNISAVILDDTCWLGSSLSVLYWVSSSWWSSSGFIVYSCASRTQHFLSALSRVGVGGGGVGPQVQPSWGEVGVEGGESVSNVMNLIIQQQAEIKCFTSHLSLQVHSSNTIKLKHTPRPDTSHWLVGPPLPLLTRDRPFIKMTRISIYSHKGLVE